MKINISVSLSKDLLQEIKQRSKNYINRSAFIESAINYYITKITKSENIKNDLMIINMNAKRLNKEALDVLTYQGLS